MKNNKQRKHKYSPRGRRTDSQSLQTLEILFAKNSVSQPLKRELLIEYLHLIQDEFRCLSIKHLVALSQLMKLSVVEVYEVASFYHHFNIVDENQNPPPDITIRVCDSITCQMHGADELVEALEKGAGEYRVQRVPCVGRCDKAPIAVVGQNPVDHANSELVQTLIANKNTTIKPIEIEGGDYPHYLALQEKFNNVSADGQSYDDLSADNANREEIIKALETSNLRGLGGAGFPVGRKWRILMAQKSPRVMAVNIDEGEPGTFKDLYYLQNKPQQFIEGMLITALTVGIDSITIYIRDEYPDCHQWLKQELERLRQDTRFKIPDIQLRRGAGAYICGEESAMIESIEGKRGMPRLRPPYVAEVGILGQATLVHNMETLFWVRDIVVKGTDWFTSQGRNGRNGLRSFSVSGRVNKAGVYLAPAGITLTELIEEYCGGMQTGHTLYGYFPGGASGGILPARLANIPLDFDTLNEYGCFIGSAAIIVFSEQDSAREIALNAMRFFEHESCGQCTPCRVGTSKAVNLMQQKVWDADLLHELSLVMQDASICGLGQAAPNPMDCVIKYFPQEIDGSEKS